MPANATIVQNATGESNHVKTVVWSLTTANPDGTAFECSDYVDRTFHATGTFGGATVAIECSNNGIDWAPATNVYTGVVTTLTAAGIRTVSEQSLFVRANLTTIGAGAVIAVTMTSARRLRK